MRNWQSVPQPSRMQHKRTIIFCFNVNIIVTLLLDACLLIYSFIISGIIMIVFFSFGIRRYLLKPNPKP